MPNKTILKIVGDKKVIGNVQSTRTLVELYNIAESLIEGHSAPEGTKYHARIESQEPLSAFALEVESGVYVRLVKTDAKPKMEIGQLWTATAPDAQTHVSANRIW